MGETIKIEMTPEEWGQVMMVLQGGIYRVVAPILQKMNQQFTHQMLEQQRQLHVVENEGDAAQ